MIAGPSQPLLSQNELVAVLEFAKALRSKRRTLDIRREGPLPQRRRGAGLELEESRPYRAGDDIRHMDWRATARSGRPMTKGFHDEKARQVWIWLDRSPYMSFGSGRENKATAAARIAALGAFATALRHGEVNAILADSQARLYSRMYGLEAVLRFVAGAVSPLPAAPFSFDAGAALDLLRGQAIKHGALLIISDFAWLTDGDATQIAEQCRGADIIALHVYDQAENQLPQGGHWLLQDPTGQDPIVVDMTDRKLRQAFDAAVAQRERFIENSWLRAGATYLRLATNSHHLDTLTEYL